MKCYPSLSISSAGIIEHPGFSGSSNRRWYQTRLDNMVKAANDHMTDLAKQDSDNFFPSSIFVKNQIE